MHKKFSLVNITGTLLVALVWISSGIFGLYIVAYYGGHYVQGDLAKWNGKMLPNLYEEGYPNAIRGVGLHFVAGGIILMLGSIQLVEGIRDRFLNFHRWVGRIYVVACIFTAIGGLMYILLKGTIGGPIMDIAFAGYGLAMLLSAVQAIRYARSKQIEAHRAWALRLYVLAIGSWLYRMYYGFMFFFDLGWHRADFLAPFDITMNFFFWVPNLLIAEFFIRSSVQQLPRWFQYAGSVILLGMLFFIGVATYNITMFAWGPAILAMFGIG
jgi:uncharacterized membrane protein